MARLQPTSEGDVPTRSNRLIHVTLVIDAMRHVVDVKRPVQFPVVRSMSGMAILRYRQIGRAPVPGVVLLECKATLWPT
jgi:hypothetical protein